MSFFKHVGTANGSKKVIIVQRELPGEDHMAAVIYSEIIPSRFHDDIMKVLESDVGQQAENLADALHRNFLPDGRNILETLHAEQMIKKIRTADVTVTPRANTKIRLDELNQMLNEMKQGEEAIKKLADNDATRGLVDAQTKRAAEQAFKDGRQAPPQASTNAALDDRSLASNMLAQAQRMEAEAKGLVAEAARMKKEAENLFPGVVPASTSSTTTVPAPKKRGRPSKQAVADAAH